MIDYVSLVIMAALPIIISIIIDITFRKTDLDDKNYAVKNGMKIGLYMNAGLIINEDILLLSGTRNSMPDAESITEDIVALIKKYCRMYVR